MAPEVQVMEKVPAAAGSCPPVRERDPEGRADDRDLPDLGRRSRGGGSAEPGGEDQQRGRRETHHVPYLPSGSRTLCRRSRPTSARDGAAAAAAASGCRAPRPCPPVPLG